MQRILAKDAPKYAGKQIKFCGWIHQIRKLGAIAFIVLRDRSGLLQGVLEDQKEWTKFKNLQDETVVSIVGKVVKEKRAPLGIELRIEKVEIISPVQKELPVAINKKEIKANLDTLLKNRTTILRSPKIREIFKLQSEILKNFRNFLTENDFIEIQCPEIVSQGAEGGTELFKVDYFGKKAYLTQSPQFYKQIMVGVFERVFCTNHVFRAELHNTSRHLNEYASLDFEVGFIDDFEDIMNLENELLSSIMLSLKKNCQNVFDLYESKIPAVPKKIPRLPLSEAQAILEKNYKQKCLGAPDLDPEHEKLICEYASKNLKSEFIFITKYPVKKRPAYTMPDKKNPQVTDSFDLLFRGLEITTGGQRIHDYNMLVDNMKKFGLNTADFGFYLDIFKFGMPPHGGLAIGLERLTARLLNLPNVKEATLFPRDLTRLTP